MSQLRIDNDGQRVVSTTYWTTEHAARGLLYLSVNAGAFRLLVPPSIESHVLPGFGGATSAVVSRGPWPAEGLADALEILLDDGSDEPWSCHLDPSQCDRLPLDADALRPWSLTVWVRGEGNTGARCLLELPCQYRRSTRLPDLRPARKGGTS